MNYWLDLFTGTTWKQFQEAGACTSGFRVSQSKRALKIKKGDIFICYLTGVMRWVGMLEVIAPSNDKRPIWGKEHFPVRFEVRPILMLEPQHGVPMRQFETIVSFYENPRQWGGFNGFIRSSLNKFKASDAEVIVKALQEAHAHPVVRPVDEKKLTKKPYYTIERKKGSATVPAVVTVPEPEPEVVEPVEHSEPASSKDVIGHTEIQFELLSLGAEMGLDVWVAKNDRGRTWKGSTLGAMPRMLDELPTQFNEATTRTIELIDVLWLKGNSILAAFEVENTTSIYSGLLRMSDLLSLQPNLDISLYIVAPDQRRDKVEQEVLRPTFNLREKPVSKVCGFLPFSKLLEKVNGIRQLGLAASLNPTFLKQAAEFFGDVEQGKSASAG